MPNRNYGRSGRPEEYEDDRYGSRDRGRGGYRGGFDYGAGPGRYGAREDDDRGRYGDRDEDRHFGGRDPDWDGGYEDRRRAGWQGDYAPDRSSRQAETMGPPVGYGPYARGASGRNAARGPGGHGRMEDLADDMFDGEHRGKGPKGYARSDDRLREDVCERLMEDGRLDASNIEVTIKKGEVTLQGEVDSRQAKRRAEDCAESAIGVAHVQNNLRVSNGNSGQAKGASSGRSTAQT